MRYAACYDLLPLLFSLCVLGSNEVVIVIFCRFEIEEVAVNASLSFSFALHTMLWTSGIVVWMDQ